MIDVTIEQDGEIKAGESRLVQFKGIEGVMNPPPVTHAIVTMTDGSQEKVPCRSIVSIQPHDETPNDEA